jgi:restriction system protein
MGKKMPTFDSLLNPTLAVLRQLGGSGSIQEIEGELLDLLDLPSEIAEVPHGDGPQTEVGYRAAWARTYLKKAGLVDNSERGVWALTPEGSEVEEIDPDALVKEIRRKQREKRKRKEAVQEDVDLDELDWKDQLQRILLEMDPIAFERLSQRLLRESGFIEVEVTERSGDGGIDGYGTIRIGGLISFNVLFQSKRYSGNIGPSVVRDFRGAMVGRADKGLIITTGAFTREARREATRDGAPPIDLIDGDLLADKLKELSLGVHTEVVEEVEVDESWFRSI